MYSLLIQATVLCLFSYLSLAQLGNSVVKIVSNIPVMVTANKSFTTAPPTWLTSPFMRANN